MRNPVFIVGVVRSGTTWVWGLLTSHTDVVPLEMHDLKPEVQSMADGQRWTSETGLFSQHSTEFAVTVVGAKTQVYPDKVVIEKTPDHVFHVQRMLDAFPSCHVILMVRDPRAVVASMLNTPFFPNPSFERFLARCRRMMAEGAKWYAHPMVTTQRYEDLLRDTPEQVKMLLETIGLDREQAPRMVEENAGVSKVRREGTYRRAELYSYRDELTGQQARRVAEVNASVMELYGYGGETA